MLGLPHDTVVEIKLDLTGAFHHLFDIPAVKLRRELNAHCVFVHGQVEVRAPPLHCDMVPVLVIEEAAEGGETPRFGR